MANRTAETVDLGSLQRAIAEATADYEARQADESRARNNATAARNKLNDLQKQLDEAVEKVRAAAAQGTTWHSFKRAGQRLGVLE